MRFRILTTLAAFAAVIGILAVGAGTAASGTYEENYNPLADPATTNVPWLAWAGETVKVSRCFGLGDSQVGQDNVSATASEMGIHFDPSTLLVGTFSKGDWSGATDQPPFFSPTSGDETSNTVSATWDINGGLCFSTDVTSLKAGLEDIHFGISTDLGRILNKILGKDIIYEQDLLVIWMWDSDPVLAEAPTTGAYQVGDTIDASGNGTYVPIADSSGHYSFEPGLIDIHVKGTFPLGNDYSGIKAGDVVTLPDDWAWLAQHFAVDYSHTLTTETFLGSAPQRWDIHDDDTAAEGHSADSGCAGGSGSVDSVDNCIGSGPVGDTGPFSSIFGLVGTYNDAIGPFDPIRPFETLLSDGNPVNADDAPMPALRVDVSLTNANADHAVGYLSKADKSLIYNRNPAAYGGNGANLDDSTKNQHLLYAPFYKALIPAVTPLFDLNTTSGVEGSLGEPDWLTWTSSENSSMDNSDGIYDYWDTFTQDYTGGYNDCRDVTGSWISKPDNVETPGSGTDVSVYTDEHGEAMVQFNPANPDGEGINLTPDGNGRCDVYTGSLVGTATIQAESMYPAKQPSDPSNIGQAKLSNVLTKTVKFTPSKVLTCIPKGKNEAYCVETVTDFEGNPVAADVEFTASGSSSGPVKIQPDSNPFGGFDPSGQTVNDYDALFVDLTTSPDTGQAGIAVHDSINECVDVSVENLDTSNPPGSFNPGIYRDFDFNPATGAACGTNTGTGPTGDQGSGGSTPPAASGGGTTVVQQSTAAPVAVTAPAPTAVPTVKAPGKVTKSAKMTLVSARVISASNGRFLNVRVNSVAKIARLRITLVNKNGSHAVVFRYVHTNKMVRVANLKLGGSVKTVRVAVA